MREPVAVAYLLARAADTIADTPSASSERRQEHLLEFRRIVAGEAAGEAASRLSASLADLQPTIAERTLLGTLPTFIALLHGPNRLEVDAVRSVTLILTEGMLFDLKSFHSDADDGIVALESTERLDEYCYLIAGCVGEFWTDISIAQTPSLKRWDAGKMRSLGVRFGMALQMTNILRDMPRDLQLGRCYLPQDALDKLGLGAQELTDPANAPKARPILIWGIKRTLELYNSAEQYIVAIPRRNLRLRLAAMWPVLIGLETLAKLADSDDWLNPEVRIRIPRRAVYGIIALSLLCGRSNALTKFWLRRVQRRVEQSVQP